MMVSVNHINQAVVHIVIQIWHACISIDEKHQSIIGAAVTAMAMPWRPIAIQRGTINYVVIHLSHGISVVFVLLQAHEC